MLRCCPQDGRTRHATLPDPRTTDHALALTGDRQWRSGAGGSATRVGTSSGALIIGSSSRRAPFSCVRCSATARSMTNSIFRTWPWAKRYHERLQLWEEHNAENCASTAGGVCAGPATERHLFLGGSRIKGSAPVAPELEEWVASQLADEAAILKT